MQSMGRQAAPWPTPATRTVSAPGVSCGSMSRLVVAGSVCVVVMLVGCGGSGRLSASDYKAKLASLNKEFETAETHAQAGRACTRMSSFTDLATSERRHRPPVQHHQPPARLAALVGKWSKRYGEAPARDVEAPDGDDCDIPQRGWMRETDEPEP